MLIVAALAIAVGAHRRPLRNPAIAPEEESAMDKKDSG
jgi:hypothetical protein